MKKKSLNVMWTMLTASTMFFAGCSNDNEEQEVVGAKGDARIEVKLAAAGIATREATGTDPAVGTEGTIYNYEVYVYQGTGSTTPSGYKQISGSGKAQLENLPVGIVEVIVVANNTSNIGSVSYEALMNLLADRVYTAAVGSHPAVSIPATGFEMTGSKTAKLVKGETNPVTVKVARLVSKHNQPKIEPTELVYNGNDQLVEDLNTLFGVNTISAGDLTEGSSEVKFTPMGYTMINGRKESKLFEDGVNAAKNYLNSVFDGNDYKYNYAADDFLPYVTDGKPVYAFENTPNEVEENGVPTGFDAKSVYAFIIKGELKYNDVPKTRYWRVNLVAKTGTETETNADNYTIYRNGSYYLTIEKLYTIGNVSPKDAEEEPSIIPAVGQVNALVKVEVKEWDLYESSTNM